jgi:hypothetical protein
MVLNFLGGGIAELVARPPTVLKEGQIMMRTNVTLECHLFKLMTDQKYQIMHVSYGFGTSNHFPVGSTGLRSAHTLNHLMDHRQVSKLDQFVTVQCSVMIKNRIASMTHHQDSLFFQRQQL